MCLFMPFECSLRVNVFSFRRFYDYFIMFRLVMFDGGCCCMLTQAKRKRHEDLSRQRQEEQQRKMQVKSLPHVTNVFTIFFPFPVLYNFW